MKKSLARSFRVFLLLAILVPLSACSENDLPKYVVLNELRILGLVAHDPEVDAGGGTTITPIISDVTESTALTFEVTGCIALSPVDSNCDGNPTATTIQTGTLNTGDMTAARHFTGAASSFTVNVPAAAVIY